MNNGTTHFTQNFHTQYIWASVKNNNVFKRSGRPGYVTGKPVILGKKTGNTTEEGELKEAIHLDTDPGQWLTILAPGRGGRCDSRSQVTLGKEMRSGCIIQVNQDHLNDCQMLQSQFLELLLGPTLHDVSGLHIASYGDSSINNVAEWAPILVPEEPRSANFLGHVLGKSRCSELILSLHIEIAYSLQGTLANLQAKVVGIVLRYGEPQTIEFTCVNLVCQTAELQNQTQAVELVSSVSFVKVTVPPQQAYSQPPTLEVKLPYDFFYPFLPSFVPVLHCELIYIWFVCYCVWYLI
ncbi:tectonic-3-like [Panulirus ornatus]|uniref:tectonic-3-like n=1 Tax=Panulirus ornatus TaxID=150431 RepID=UPI003A835910